MRIPLLLIALFNLTCQAQTIKESYAFMVIDAPKYAINFTHFDYVNSAAAKGDTMTMSAIATFDNFNRFAQRSNPDARTDTLYDTLFTTSDDEQGSYYPLVAEMERYPTTIRGSKLALIRRPASTTPARSKPATRCLPL